MGLILICAGCYMLGTNYGEPLGWSIFCLCIGFCLVQRNGQ